MPAPTQYQPPQANYKLSEICIHILDAFSLKNLKYAFEYRPSAMPVKTPNLKDAISRRTAAKKPFAAWTPTDFLDLGSREAYTYTADGYLAETDLTIGTWNTGTSTASFVGSGSTLATDVRDAMGRLTSHAENIGVTNSFTRSVTYDRSGLDTGETTSTWNTTTRHFTSNVEDAWKVALGLKYWF